jgi:hypothetical protein
MIIQLQKLAIWIEKPKKFLNSNFNHPCSTDNSGDINQIRIIVCSFFQPVFTTLFSLHGFYLINSNVIFMKADYAKND